MKNCTVCGAPLDDEVKYCAHCGAQQPETPAAPAAPEQAAAPAAPEAAAPAAAPEQAAAPAPELTLDDPFAKKPAEEPAAPAEPPVGAAPSLGDGLGPIPGAPNPPIPPQEPPVAPQQPAGGPAPRSLRDAGFSALIDALASNFFMAIVILQTANIGLVVIGAATADRYNVVSNTLVSLLTMVFPILFCVALWLCFTSARGVQQGGAFSTNGLTMYRTSFKVCTIISWVLMGLVAVVLLIGGGALISAAGSGLLGSYAGDLAYYGGYYGDYGDIGALAGAMGGALIGIVVVVLGAMVALTVISYIKTMRTLDALLLTARTGEPTRFVSMFLIVIGFISGGFAALSALGTMLNGALLSGLGSGCGAAATIMISVGMLRYKSKVEGLQAAAGAQAYR